MGDKQNEDLSANVSIIILNMDDPSAPSKRLVECIKNDSTTHCLQEIHFHFNDIGLKQKRYHINVNERDRSGYINFWKTNSSQLHAFLLSAWNVLQMLEKNISGDHANSG